MILNSHKTAIARNTLPVPVRWLQKNGLIKGKYILDFGCGKCIDINPPDWDNYDPHFRPWSCWHKQVYDTILCTYVLCTLPESEERPILKEIQKKLKPTGAAFISVRNDTPKSGHGISSKGTFQRKVVLPYLFEIRATSQYRTYLLTKKDVVSYS